MDKFSDYSPLSGAMYNRPYLSSTPDVLQSVCVDKYLSAIFEALFKSSFMYIFFNFKFLYCMKMWLCFEIFLKFFW